MATTTTTTAKEDVELTPITRLSPTSIALDQPTQDDQDILQALQDGPAPTTQPKLQLTLTILQPSLINFFCSFSNGVITIGLPAIAKSIDLERSLYLWPSSVFGLTCGSVLLIAGSVADLVGVKNVEVVGCVLLGIFTLLCGFSQSGIQIVMFRALQGIAMAMHLPSSVAIVANAVPKGRARNIGFACLGLSQPLGFSVGLVASGIMVQKIGWRSGFYLSGAALLVLAAAAIPGLPGVKPDRSASPGMTIWRRLYTQVDWVGGLVASGGLAILAYILA